MAFVIFTIIVCGWRIGIREAAMRSKPKTRIQRLAERKRADDRFKSDDPNLPCLSNKGLVMNPKAVSFMSRLSLDPNLNKNPTWRQDPSYFWRKKEDG
jgi:hypothetical protein